LDGVSLLLVGMHDEEQRQAEAERRTAAGRIATWFGAEFDLLLATLRGAVDAAPERASQELDEQAAERVLSAARGCSKRASILLGLRKEPWLPVSSNLGQALAATLAQYPHLRERGVRGAILESVLLPLPEATLRTVIKELLGNACEASAAAPTLELRESDGHLHLWVISDGALSLEHAKQAPFPFFSTKAGHAGLGLSLVHTAAENQGGRLRHQVSTHEVRIGVAFPVTPGQAGSPGAESNVSFACQLAATLAHDANNALMAALGWAEILADARDEAERSEALATLSQAADYLEAMSYLLPYEARPTRSDAALDLESAFERMRPLLKAVLEHKADRKIALAVRPVQGTRVAMSEDALRSVVLRLAENARDGMPAGGTWTVAWDKEARGPLLTLSAEVRRRDPTAERGQPASVRVHGPDRVALGLAVARDLVQSAGGSFEVEPQTPPAPSVRIRLPSRPN
jgi:signal transduction histidine kinase